jgi:hypothetical protein
VNTEPKSKKKESGVKPPHSKVRLATMANLGAHPAFLASHFASAGAASTTAHSVLLDRFDIFGWQGTDGIGSRHSRNDDPAGKVKAAKSGRKPLTTR